jgi:hypothetical protein
VSRTGPLLAREPIAHYRSIGAFGSPVYQNHAQLRALLVAQRMPELARFLSIPVYEKESAELRWHAESGSTVQLLSSLQGPARADAEARLQALGRQRDELAQRLRARTANPGGANAAFAALVDEAFRVPHAVDFIRVVDGEPVACFWGFADGRGESMDAFALPPPVQAAPTPIATEATPLEAAVSPAPLLVADKPGRIWRWWWLLLLLPLLLALAWALSRCSVPVPPAVTPEPPAMPDTSGRRAEQSLDIPPGALEREDLSFLKGQWQLGEDRLSIYRGGPVNVVGSGRAVLEFNADGTGRSRMVEQRQHGKGTTEGPPLPPCSGSLKATTDGKVLTIVQGPCVREDDPSNVLGGSRAECRRTPEGRTMCETVNQRDGVRWEASLRRIGG